MKRSYLFVPGNRPERFDKACIAGADAVIIDLEDAVPPDEKPAARAAVVGWLSAEKPVLIRINSGDSQWFADDLALCSLPGVAGVVLPKAERVIDVAAVRAAGAAAILPLIESALGVWNAHAIASSAGVQRLVFGSIDLSVDLGIHEGVEELQYFRSQVVLVSRVARIEPPVDGVTLALDDADRIAGDTLRARRHGFGAKLCIHPRQVEVVNQAFRPTDSEIAWAVRVLQAADAADGAAVALDGKMVDKPVILAAQRIVYETQRVGDDRPR
ncbi:MAG: CoA ester lyase [Burkholderiaceae bacterium]